MPKRGQILNLKTKIKYAPKSDENSNSRMKILLFSYYSFSVFPKIPIYLCQK